MITIVKHTYLNKSRCLREIKFCSKLS